MKFPPLAPKALVATPKMSPNMMARPTTTVVALAIHTTLLSALLIIWISSPSNVGRREEHPSPRITSYGSSVLPKEGPAYHSIAVFLGTFLTNFRESPKGELRRIPIPRTPVNKSGQASSEARSDYTRRCCRHLRLLWVLLLSVLARKVLGTVHNDHHYRHRAPQRCVQPRLPHRVHPREHRAEETA